eukprot:scaffold4274_cov175-Amphora_coffeaeformis.AAC.2
MFRNSGTVAVRSAKVHKPIWKRCSRTATRASLQEYLTKKTDKKAWRKLNIGLLTAPRCNTKPCAVQVAVEPTFPHNNGSSMCEGAAQVVKMNGRE